MLKESLCHTEIILLHVFYFPGRVFVSYLSDIIMFLKDKSLMQRTYCVLSSHTIDPL